MMAGGEDDERGRFYTEKRLIEEESPRKRKCVSVHLLADKL